MVGRHFTGSCFLSTPHHSHLTSLFFETKKPQYKHTPGKLGHRWAPMDKTSHVSQDRNEFQTEVNKATEIRHEAMGEITRRNNRRRKNRHERYFPDCRLTMAAAGRASSGTTLRTAGSSGGQPGSWERPDSPAGREGDTHILVSRFLGEL